MKSEDRQPDTKKVLVWVLVGLLLILGGYVAYQLVKSHRIFPSKPTTTLFEISKEAKEEPTEGEKEQKVAISIPLEPTKTVDPCKEIQRNITEVLAYLKSNKEYKEAYGNMDPKEFFNQVVTKLTHSLPYMDHDEQALFKAQFHMFRALGYKDLKILLSVLEHDESIEVILKDLYNWFVTPQCEISGLIKPKMEHLVIYVKFLLHTLPGNAYLERRKDSTRFFITYYCLMVLKNANIKDIKRQHVGFCMNYLNKHKDTLYYKDEYTKNIEEISRP